MDTVDLDQILDDFEESEECQGMSRRMSRFIFSLISDSSYVLGSVILFLV